MAKKKAAVHSRSNQPFTAYGYVRSATGNPEHIEEQKAAILDYFERYGLQPGLIVVEGAGSGMLTPSDHPAFVELLRKLQSGDTLIVTSVDRLGRDSGELVKTIRDLASRGVKVMLITGDIVQPE